MPRDQSCRQFQDVPRLWSKVLHSVLISSSIHSPSTTPLLGGSSPPAISVSSFSLSLSPGGRLAQRSVCEGPGNFQVRVFCQPTYSLVFPASSLLFLPSLSCPWTCPQPVLSLRCSLVSATPLLSMGVSPAPLSLLTLLLFFDWLPMPLKGWPLLFFLLLLSFNLRPFPGVSSTASPRLRLLSLAYGLGV